MKLQEVRHKSKLVSGQWSVLHRGLSVRWYSTRPVVFDQGSNLH